MNITYPYPVVTGMDGKPTHYIVPIEDMSYRMMNKCEDRVKIPEAVAEYTFQGFSPLKAWRKYKGLRQEEVAKLMGKSRNAYSQNEKNGIKPRLETIRAFAEALDLDMRQVLQLFDDEPVKEPNLEGVDLD